MYFQSSVRTGKKSVRRVISPSPRGRFRCSNSTYGFAQGSYVEKAVQGAALSLQMMARETGRGRVGGHWQQEVHCSSCFAEH
jgi:hypothetical protein